MRTIAVVMKRKTAKIKTRPWDPAEHLTTEGDMAAYLEAAFEDGDPALIAAALGDIARAKGMSQIARETGLGRESLYKALSPDGNPEFSTVAQGRARARPPLARSGRCLITGSSHGKRDWSEDRKYRRGGIGKILGG